MYSEKPPKVVPSELQDTVVAREVASSAMRWAMAVLGPCDTWVVSVARERAFLSNKAGMFRKASGKGLMIVQEVSSPVIWWLFLGHCCHVVVVGEHPWPSETSGGI